MGITGDSTEFFVAGVTGKHASGGSGVEGRTNTAATQVSFGSAGVAGINEGFGAGVHGLNTADSAEGRGVLGAGAIGVEGRSIHPQGAGVLGAGQFGAPGLLGRALPGHRAWSGRPKAPKGSVCTPQAASSPGSSTVTSRSTAS